VHALAAARKQGELTEDAALVSEMLAGRSARPLPASVVAALRQLELATAANSTSTPLAGEATAW
jgi:hypothetical protein